MTSTMSATSSTLIANWKSHKTIQASQEWLEELAIELKIQPLKQTQIALAVPFPFLAVASWWLSQHPELAKNVTLAVQDLSPFPAGAYTGAISGENIKDLSIGYALLGHSERRRYFHETHQDVANKVEQAVASGLTPVVCVDKDYIAAQAAAISQDLLAKCWVAYEPLEAIGSGQEEPAETVVAVFAEIKEVWGSEVPVIYGGSVSGDNVSSYLEIGAGVLVGGQSLKVSSFAKIIRASEKVSR
jgi:triosephosphate isomerase (TIM)